MCVCVCVCIDLFTTSSRNALLTIEVLPTAMSEVEENFTVAMVTASQGVLIDSDASSIVITVSVNVEVVK